MQIFVFTDYFILNKIGKIVKVEFDSDYVPI